MNRLLRVLPLAVLLAAFAPAAPQGTASHGQWVRAERKDKVSGISSAAYALTGHTADQDRKPSIVLSCDGDRDPSLVYHADIQLGVQAHNVLNHYADAIWAYVKVDNARPYRAVWEIIPGENKSFNQALIDKKTLRNLFTGAKMRVVFRDYQDEQHIDDFDLAGLTVNDLQPFCSATWIAKNDLAKASRPAQAAGPR